MNAFYILVVFVATTLSITLAANCYGPTSPIFINEFSAFPSPVGVGETVYIRAKITPDHNISAALVQVRVYYSTNTNLDTQSPIISMSGLDFCSLSTKFSCPLTTAGSILAWEFVVPNIPAGTYQVKYNIIELNATDPTTASSCIQFSIEVSGTNASPIFNSWYQATLLGTAVFTSPGDYTTRVTGQSLQVGPSGPLNFSSPPYGSINGLSGSGDLVPSSTYDTSAFVWGLSGTMTSMSIGNPSTVQTHVYQGTCYLGYISGDYNYDYTNPLLTGTFHLTWSYMSGSTAHISGYATFSPNATIPPGWGYPLMFGRLQQHQIVTSDTGFLLIQASAPYCTSDGTNCNLGSAAPISTGGSSGLSSSELGLAIGLPIAVVFVVVLVAAALLWNKRRRETEQEDGIFAVARKPEYGSALVVDDIIEETRGSKNLRAMLSPNAYSDDEAASNDGESDDRSASRSRSRSASRRSVSHSRSVSRSRSRSSEGRSNRSSDNESDAGESASRGRHSASEYSD